MLLINFKYKIDNKSHSERTQGVDRHNSIKNCFFILSKGFAGEIIIDEPTQSAGKDTILSLKSPDLFSVAVNSVSKAYSSKKKKESWKIIDLLYFHAP